MTSPKITQPANVCLAPTQVPFCCSRLLPPGAEARLGVAELFPPGTGYATKLWLVSAPSPASSATTHQEDDPSPSLTTIPTPESEEGRDQGHPGSLGLRALCLAPGLL